MHAVLECIGTPCAQCRESKLFRGLLSLDSRECGVRKQCCASECKCVMCVTVCCGVCVVWLRQSLAELAKKAGLDLNEHKISSGKAMAAATA